VCLNGQGVWHPKSAALFIVLFDGCRSRWPMES
jgi:hypothetical protein